MIFAVLSIIFWALMLIKDTREFIEVKNTWGKEHTHKTFIVLDIIFLVFTVGATIYMLR